MARVKVTQCDNTSRVVTSTRYARSPARRRISTPPLHWFM